MTVDSDSHSHYENPLSRRYASSEMSELFSERTRILNWRELWITLAKCQRTLGLQISASQIEEMEATKNAIDFDDIKKLEKMLRHDVMANIHSFAKVCPNAGKIIHLGATSCFVTDNSDLITIKTGFLILKKKLVNLISTMSRLAKEYSNVPCLAYTHFQPAQLTTVGKRICIWLQDLTEDLRNLSRIENNLKFRGAKGTTGTQSSFLELFENDFEKVLKLDEMVTAHFGFVSSVAVCGQTYSRKTDVEVVNCLGSFAASAHKISTDIRLLCHLNEFQEPFEDLQVGSSAMAYKRNPMRSERCCGLSRHLMTLVGNALHTAANQWLERTLDDSANRRLTLPESFLTADSLLLILNNVFQGIRINIQVIARHVEEELPFMVTECVIMEMVKCGNADRQECHEKIRKLSMECRAEMSNNGTPNRLFEKLSTDPYFAPIKEKIGEFKRPEKIIGACEMQVERFLKDEVSPLLVLGVMNQPIYDLSV